VGYAGKVAEAAEIPMRSQNYTPVTFTCDKWAERSGVSNEVIRDGMVDAIVEEVKQTGKRVMLGFEQECNNIMLEASGDEWDATGTAGSLGMKAAIKAMSQAIGNGFSPSAVVMHPGFMAYCLMDIASPNPNPLNVQAIPDGHLGMICRSCGVADVAGGTYTFGSGTDNYIMGMVVDAARAGGIVHAQQMEINEYKDAIHDLSGFTACLRADVNAFIPTATVRVKY
jgi:hypothetical protein